MTSGAAKAQVLSIYKSLMRESQKFTNYNFRAYTLRRVRDAFKDNKALTDSKLVKKEMEFAKENLMIIRRQATVGWTGVVRNIKDGDNETAAKSIGLQLVICIEQKNLSLRTCDRRKIEEEIVDK